MDGIGLVQPLPGAREFVRWLAERGHAVILSSSAKEEELDVYLDMLDVGDAITAHTTSAELRAAGAGGVFEDLADLRAHVADTPLGTD